jgi:hypothetical protein
MSKSDAPELMRAQGGVVRVTIPAEAAFNLDKLQKIVAATVARLGCPNCHSGRDILFMAERDFVVNPKTLDVIPAPALER